MPESRKVREFLDHINCNEMEAGKANVLADEVKSENFIATANYLSFFAVAMKFSLLPSSANTFATLASISLQFM